MKLKIILTVLLTTVLLLGVVAATTLLLTSADDADVTDDAADLTEAVDSEGEPIIEEAPEATAITGSGSLSEGVVENTGISLGSPLLDTGFITNGNKALYVVYTKALKANTDYKVTWELRSQCFGNTGATYYYSETGKTNAVSVDTSYTPNDGLGRYYTAENDTDLLCQRTNGVTFTSEAEGSIFAVILCQWDYTNDDDCHMMVDCIDQYLTYFNISEVG